MSLKYVLVAAAFVLTIAILDVDALASGRVKRHDRFRCEYTNGFLCKWTCRLMGQSGGTCDDADECQCSEEKLEKFVCGRDARDNMYNGTADALCAGWCQFKGRQTGDCNFDIEECECVEPRLEDGHVKCISEETCSIYCQLKGSAAGECVGEHGWDCVCKSNQDDYEYGLVDDI